MKRSLTFAVAALAAFTLVAAGCGDTDEVPADAVAVVDGTEITRASLDELLARAKKSYTSRKRTFPKAGTAEYQQLQTQAVAFLVQREEYAREAEELDIDGDGRADHEEDRRGQEAVLRQRPDRSSRRVSSEQGYTEATLREDIQAQLVAEGIYEKVANDVKVSDADVQKYYDENKAPVHRRGVARRPPHPRQDEGRGRQDPRRSSTGGADFATLAKQSSLDPGSKDQGGKLTVIPRPDRGAVRQGRLLAEDEPALRADQDRVRLPPDRAARGGQGGVGDAVRPGQGPDPHAARLRAQEHGGQRLGRRRSQRSTRTRSRTRPASRRRTRRPPAKRRPATSSVRGMTADGPLADLRELTRRLRVECPWDREQTARTIVPHTVEEAYEVADAALADDPAKAPRRAGRPAVPGLLPLAAARGAGRGRPRRGDARGAREARPPAPARLRRRRGPHRRTRARAVGGDQDGGTRAAAASSTTCRRRSRRCSRRGRRSDAPPRWATTGPTWTARRRRCARSSTSCAPSSCAPGGRRRRPSPTGGSRGARRPALHGRQPRAVRQRRPGARAAWDDRAVPRAGRARRAARRRGGGDVGGARPRRAGALVRAGKGRARRRRDAARLGASRRATV